MDYAGCNEGKAFKGAEAKSSVKGMRKDPPLAPASSVQVLGHVLGVVRTRDGGLGTSRIQDSSQHI